MAREDLVKHVRTVVEREAHVPYQAPLLCLGGKLPDAVVLVVVDVSRRERVQQVEVEVACPGALERHCQLPLGLLRALSRPWAGIDLVRKVEALARVALDQEAACGLLASLVDVGGVEVAHARVEKGVGHGLALLDVDGLAICQARQTHEAKPQFRHGSSKELVHGRSSPRGRAMRQGGSPFASFPVWAKCGRCRAASRLPSR